MHLLGERVVRPQCQGDGAGLAGAGGDVVKWGGKPGRRPGETVGVREMEWLDHKCRCRWANPGNPAYVRYHDEEWGVPVHEDRRLFEMLLLEGFQAGLSWECILNKRAAFRRAFDNFEADLVCAYGEEKIQALMGDPGIVRNQRKIRAAVRNAGVFREIQREWGSFSDYLWHWTGGRTVREVGQTRSPLSDAVSRDLKRRGMGFVGTTIVYAYLQAVGVISSHEPGCFLAEDGSR